MHTKETIKIAIGVDHRAYNLKEFLLQQKKIDSYTLTWIDCGTFTDERTDYPIYVSKVVTKLKNKEADLALLSCGSGVGMAIAANRYAGIYAGLVWNERVTELAKMADNINALVLPADFISQEEALKIITAWLATPFGEGRYAERIAMIDALQDPGCIKTP